MFQTTNFLSALIEANKDHPSLLKICNNETIAMAKKMLLDPIFSEYGTTNEEGLLKVFCCRQGIDPKTAKLTFVYIIQDSGKASVALRIDSK